MKGSWLLGLSRAVAYLLLTLLAMPIQLLALLLSRRMSDRFPVVYHGWTTRLLGIAVEVRGAPSTARPTLFVSNHTSYFDIEVLGSLIPCSFIARADMADWPLIGWLAKLQRSVFVDRKRENASRHAGDVAQRLAAGDNLVLFAEGTTSDGSRLLPFKSALFSVAEQAGAEAPLTVQPVSVVATHLDGIPLGRSLRSLYSWYGDMPMGGHLWQALTLGKLTVSVEFHEPFLANGHSRKALSDRCRKAVTEGFSRAITGRAPPARIETPDEAGTGAKNVEAAA